MSVVKGDRQDGPVAVGDGDPVYPTVQTDRVEWGSHVSEVPYLGGGGEGGGRVRVSSAV